VSVTRLHPDDLAALAELLAEQVVDRAARLIVDGLAQRLGEVGASEPADRLLTAAEVAQRLGVARSMVYAHAHELGGVRVGDGPKARWRFNAAEVDARLRARSIGEDSQQAASPVTAAMRPDRLSAFAPNGLDSVPEQWREAVLSGGQQRSAPASAQTPPGPAPEIAAPMRPARYSSPRGDARSSLPLSRPPAPRPKGAKVTGRSGVADAAVTRTSGRGVA
jgi:excisionase family DNA binding protein